MRNFEIIITASNNVPEAVQQLVSSFRENFMEKGWKLSSIFLLPELRAAKPTALAIAGQQQQAYEQIFNCIGIVEEDNEATDVQVQKMQALQLETNRLLEKLVDAQHETQTLMRKMTDIMQR